MKKIILTRGKISLVDDVDYEFLNQFKWHCVPGRYTWYAVRGVGPHGKQKKIYMQHTILNTPKGMTIDHLNKNGLDNRKRNLRICTKSQNSHNYKTPRNNTSGVKGVFLDRKKWRAAIRINYKRIYLGSFLTLEEAKKAYKEANAKYFKNEVI